MRAYGRCQRVGVNADAVEDIVAVGVLLQPTAGAGNEVRFRRHKPQIVEQRRVRRATGAAAVAREIGWPPQAGDEMLLIEHFRVRRLFRPAVR